MKNWMEDIGKAVRPELESLSTRIQEESKAEKPDTHKIMRLEEAKLMHGMLCSEIFGSHNKYRSPF